MIHHKLREGDLLQISQSKIKRSIAIDAVNELLLKLLSASPPLGAAWLDGFPPNGRESRSSPVPVESEGKQHVRKRRRNPVRRKEHRYRQYLDGAFQENILRFDINIHPARHVRPAAVCPYYLSALPNSRLLCHN
eukprot:756999-Hanusia_phi.AAC.1